MGETRAESDQEFGSQSYVTNASYECTIKCELKIILPFVVLNLFVEINFLFLSSGQHKMLKQCVVVPTAIYLKRWDIEVPAL